MKSLIVLVISFVSSQDCPDQNLGELCLDSCDKVEYYLGNLIGSEVLTMKIKLQFFLKIQLYPEKGSCRMSYKM